MNTEEQQGAASEAQVVNRVSRQQERQMARTQAWGFVQRKYRNSTMRGFSWAGDLSRRGARRIARQLAKVGPV